MSTLDLFQRLALALAIGLLIGTERGWQDRGKKPGTRAAGIRTFALIGLLGGIWGLLAPLAGAAVLGFGALGFAASFALFEWRETRAEGSFSATGLVAGLLAFALGAYAALGNLIAAGSAAVAATLILAERRVLHAFLEAMSWAELRAALLLLVMSFVLLPLLPDRAVDPWQTINPHQIWLFTILIAALSYAGYIAVKLAGGRNGLLFAGATGGLVSSTTVTWTFARLSAQHPESLMEFLAGIVASWAVSFLRVIVVATVVSLSLGVLIAEVLGGGLLILVCMTGLFYWRAAAHASDAPLQLKDPFELDVVLRFAALLTFILLAVKFASHLLGEGGVVSLAALSGAADVDPILLSVAQAVGHGMSRDNAALAILAAVAANTAAKSVLGGVFGGRRAAAILSAVGFLAMSAATAAFYALG